jgi:N-acetylneuraminic acid mutarotase
VFAATIAGRVYVVGGRDEFVNRSATQIYDPTTDTWTQGTLLPVPTSGMALVAFRERLFAIGGEDLTRQLVVRATQRYDPVANRWERLADLPNGVHGVAGAAIGDSIYLFGGSAQEASGEGTNLVQRLAF